MNLEIPGKILVSSLAGSHAYGLNVTESDMDYRGVFVAEKEEFYSLNFQKEVSDETNDCSYFELSKFVELLSKNNPTVLEILAYDDGVIQEKHSEFSKFKVEDFLTMRCKESFTGYALAQIRKAHKLKKRINFPEDNIKKNPIDFCFLLIDGMQVPLSETELSKGNISVSDLNNENGIYSIWKSEDEKMGVSFYENGEIKTGAKTEEFLGNLFYSKTDWKKYSREYDSFFKWKSKSNSVEDSSRVYDGKFLMHTFRLLYTAKDIATKKKLILKRPEREFLLQVRNQEFPFNELISKAEELLTEVRELFDRSGLPEEIDFKKLNQLHYEVRAGVYLY